MHDAASGPFGRNRARRPPSRRPRRGGIQCVSGLPVSGIEPGKSAAGTFEWADAAPRASPPLPGVSTHHRSDLCRGRSRRRNSGRPSLSRRPVVACTRGHRRSDKRMGSPQFAALLPRPISTIGFRNTTHCAFGISERLIRIDYDAGRLGARRDDDSDRTGSEQSGAEVHPGESGRRVMPPRPAPVNSGQQTECGSSSAPA